MPAINDIIRFTIRQRVNQVFVYNVDFKRYSVAPSNPLTMFEMARAYHEQWVDNIIPHVGTNAAILSVTAENLTDGLEFSEYASEVLGLGASPTLPSFNALGIRLNRSTKLTRNGYKRIAGIQEAQVTLNAMTLTPAVFDDFERLFQNTVVFNDLANPPDTFEMETVIVGRTPNASGVYELDLTKINPVSTAVGQANVTTQNSRKPDS